MHSKAGCRESASKRVSIWNAGAQGRGAGWRPSHCQHAEPMPPRSYSPAQTDRPTLSPTPLSPPSGSSAAVGCSRRFEHARPHAKRHLGRLLRACLRAGPLPEPCVCSSGTASGGQGGAAQAHMATLARLVAGHENANNGFLMQLQTGCLFFFLD